MLAFLFYLLRLRHYKAKCVKTRCLQEGVGHLDQGFRGKGSFPCQYIDITRKAIDCATSLPLTVFITARNARIASAVLTIAIPSVRPSVCRSVCPSHAGIVKTTARSTVQFALLDSKMCLVLQKPKNIPQDDPFPLKFWLKVLPILEGCEF